MDIIGYIKEYFSRASDFVGEEYGESYRRYCLIEVIGFVAFMFAMKVMSVVLRPIVQIGVFNIPLTILLFALPIIWVEPLVAATVRRTWTLGRSRLWVIVVMLPIWPLAPWLFLGEDPEK